MLMVKNKSNGLIQNRFNKSCFTKISSSMITSVMKDAHV